VACEIKSGIDRIDDHSYILGKPTREIKPSKQSAPFCR
jgi:hypothetical protein